MRESWGNKHIALLEDEWEAVPLKGQNSFAIHLIEMRGCADKPMCHAVARAIRSLPNTN